MEAVEIKIQVVGADKAQRDLQKVSNDVASFSAGIGSIASGTILAELALAALTAAADLAGKALEGMIDTAVSSLESASSLQQVRQSLEQMLGPAGDAEKLLEDLSKFARVTPFNLTDLQGYTKQLVAAGFEQDEILTSLEALGDVAAGVGSDKLPFLIYALGQTRVAGKFAGNDLLQLRNAGINVDQVFRDKLGMSVQQVNDAIADGRLTYKEAEDALLSLGREGGKFDGLMEDQARTLPGVISNLEDLRDSLLRTLGGVTEGGDVVKGGFLDQVTDAVLQLQKFLLDNEKIISEFAANIGKSLGTAVNFIKDFFIGLTTSEGAQTAFRNMADSVKILFDRLVELVQIFAGPVQGELGTNEVSAKSLGEMFGITLANAIKNVTNGLSSAINFYIMNREEIDAIIRTSIEFIKTLVNVGLTIIKFVIGAKQAISNWVRSVSETVNTIKSKFIWLRDQIKGILSNISDIGRNMVDGIKKGFTDRIATLRTEVSKRLTGVVQLAKQILGIRSPSRVFMKVGQNVVEGFNMGMQRTPIGGGVSSSGNSREMISLMKQMMSRPNVNISGTNFSQSQASPMQQMNSFTNLLLQNT